MTEPRHPAIRPGAVAVVTGGASGIGLAAARRFGAAGMTVILADLDAAALDAAVAAQAALLCRAAPEATGMAKALVRRAAHPGDARECDRANADLIARLRVTAEGQEGISAFLEKRAPAWAPHPPDPA